MIPFLVIGLLDECCVPKDCWEYCRVTYEGQKNYFDSNNCSCEVPVQCPDEQIYDFENNLCLNQSQIPKVNFNNNSTETAISETSSKCTNGQLRGGVCFCDSGYTTSKYQEGEMEECDTQIESAKNSFVGQPDSQTLSFIEIIAILAAISIVSCCISCFVKRKMKKKYINN